MEVDLIEAYGDHLTKIGRAAGTIELYQWLLRRVDDQVTAGLADANAVELSGWLYAGPRSPATTVLYHKIITGFYTWATDPRHPYLDWNPATLLPDAPTLPRRSPRPLDVEQLAGIVRRAREPYRTWIVLAAAAGLRCCEISALDREHVTAAAMWVHGKGDHERTIPTGENVWRAVRDLPPGPVARNRDGTRADRQRVQRRANRHLRRDLGLPHVTMHRFRHTYATLIYQATGDIYLVRALLGHASVATTQVYAEVSTAAMVAAVKRLPRVA